MLYYVYVLAFGSALRYTYMYCPVHPELYQLRCVFVIDCRASVCFLNSRLEMKLGDYVYYNIVVGCSLFL